MKNWKQTLKPVLLSLFWITDPLESLMKAQCEIQLLNCEQSRTDSKDVNKRPHRKNPRHPG